MKTIGLLLLALAISVPSIQAKEKNKKYKSNEINIVYPDCFDFEEEREKYNVVITFSGNRGCDEVCTVTYSRMMSSASVHDLMMNCLQTYVDNGDIPNFLYGDTYNSSIGKYNACAINFSHTVLGMEVNGVVKAALVEKNVIITLHLIYGDGPATKSQAIEESIVVNPKAFNLEADFPGLYK